MSEESKQREAAEDVPKEAVSTDEGAESANEKETGSSEGKEGSSEKSSEEAKPRRKRAAHVKGGVEALTDDSSDDADGYMYGRREHKTVTSLSGSQQVNQREIYKENPRVYYMNGESLNRPLSLPPNLRKGVIAIVCIAIAIAIVFLYFYFDKTWNEPARLQAQMEENLAKDVNLDLPNLLSFLDKSDAEIDQTLKDSNAVFFEKIPVGTGPEYEIIKLPEGMTLADAAALYAIGIEKLNASQMVQLLNGSWDLDIDRTNGLNMSLHYADFKSGTLTAAIKNAIREEGFDRGDETSSGNDDGFGNAFSSGTIMVDAKQYSWNVSAVSLSEVHSVPGLPADAIYVGIRILYNEATA